MRALVRLLLSVVLVAWAPALVPVPSTRAADASIGPDSATTRYKPATAPGAQRARERTIAPFPVPGDTSALSVLRWRMLNVPRSGGTTVAPLPPPGAHASPGGSRGLRLPASDSLTQARLDAHASDCVDEYPDLPEVVTRVAPVLPLGLPPREASRVVRVFFVVDETGMPRGAHTPGPPSSLDSAAVTCVSQWRFRPGRHCGHVYPVWVAVPVRFAPR